VVVEIAREGAFTIAEDRIGARREAPLLHRHDHDETCYVLAGELTFEVGGELLTARERRCVFVPGGVPHAVANRGPAEARHLTICTPPPGREEATGRAMHTGAAREVPELPGRVKVLVRGGDGSGRVAVMDDAIEAGHVGPPLHHHAFDEAFYVIDGMLTFRLGDEDVTCSRGELAFAPGGTPHTFANCSGRDARMLIVCTPAGFERYFERLAAHELGAAPPPDDLEAWPELTVVGPRIGEDTC
jgi:quercetin dioxygenase-like cupin family protein